MLETLQAIEYGHLPAAPDAVSSSLLHLFTLKQADGVQGAHYRLTAQPCGACMLTVLFTPRGPGPFPVIIDGDDCWRGITEDIVYAVAERGYALAIFNRVEIMPDHAESVRDTGLYTVFPTGDFGALAAWAWGYHRVVDFVSGVESIDAARIAVTGHSRGGKSALLAGAIDERIALTVANDSGCGGAGCYRFPDEGGERLADIMTNIPYWFTPRLKAFIGHEEELPFDQHSLKAAVAPRALLTTEAREDKWASPHGTRLTYEGAREVFRFLDAEARIGIWYRDGGHAHTLEDWEAMLDFADVQFFHKPAVRNFDMKS